MRLRRGTFWRGLLGLAVERYENDQERVRSRSLLPIKRFFAGSTVSFVFAVTRADLLTIPGL